MTTTAKAEVVGGATGIVPAAGTGTAGAVALRSLTLRNVLSFGAETTVELGPLNVLIGPNGCGKSNLMDVVALLKAAGGGYLSDEFRGGGAHWPWNDGRGALPEMRVESEWREPGSGARYRHEMAIQVDKSGAYAIVDESAGTPERPRAVRRPENLEPGVSFLRAETGAASSAADAPGPHCARWALGPLLADVETYRSRYVGRAGRLNPLRNPSRADAPDWRLTETLDNFAAVLRRIYDDPARKDAIDEKLRELDEDARGLGFEVGPGGVRVVFQDAQKYSFSAARMSDGMLNWLFLLAVLLAPKPPALACIDEPEFGLHMDSLPALAELLRDASSRMQLIVTTHSDLLVDLFTDTPEAVVVCGMRAGVTEMRRLSAKDLEGEEGLGDAWLSGVLGGKRW